MKWKQVSKLLYDQVINKGKGIVPLKDYDPSALVVNDQILVEGSGNLDVKEIRRWMWDNRKQLENSVAVVAKQEEDFWVLASCEGK